MREHSVSLAWLLDRLGASILDRIYSLAPIEHLRETALLCSFEGICGSGKTTQINRLSAMLESVDVSVGQFHIPGYGVSKISGFLRAFYRRPLLFERVHRHFPTLNLFLIMLDFWESTHRYQSSFPLSHSPEIVLMSRGLVSTYVYNTPILEGFYKSLQIATERTREYCKHFWTPDILFYLDLAPSVAYGRITRSRQIRRYHESLGGLSCTHALFRQFIETEVEESIRYVEVDGTQPIDRISGLALSEILQTSLSDSRWSRISSCLKDHCDL